ncbi:ABC-2 family transporter permease [Anaerosacchariphilus polymeriproducens]|uniref:ABC transporter permease n=1 Tax=Anaerosacchariphilus polymeriproducens TaxID=1812858 RepID=A0A371AZ86_9FIRM|nr:ABC transporter permease [Anaerosacchariphilus polymeriproducens]RDU24871.1 ABC transporter permease [Anaerosacchariphilus polymeriproducens]
MFMSLFLKECKIWCKSILFYAYIIILFFFYVTQMRSESAIKRPRPGEKEYGITYSENNSDIMNGTLKVLLNEYYNNKFVTYPMGFYKPVILSANEIKQVEKNISKLTGITEKDWKEKLDHYYESKNIKWSFYITKDIGYNEFLSIMSDLEKVIGKGSKYSAKALKGNAKIAKTYEQALKEYDEFLKKDKVTRAYARVFSDYMGIVLAILPAFFGVARVLQDKRSNASAVIYSKKCSSIIIVLSRCLAIIVMLFIPVLILSCFSLVESLYIAKTMGAAPDYFVYLKFCIGWLLPILMFVSMLSYFITELTNSILALLINSGIWFVSVFLGFDSPLISVGWNLVPRFNIIGMHGMFQEIFPQLVKNRILYSILGVFMILISILIYSIKREGGHKFYGKISQNFNNQS